MAEVIRILLSEEDVRRLRVSLPAPRQRAGLIGQAVKVIAWWALFYILMLAAYFFVYLQGEGDAKHDDYQGGVPVPADVAVGGGGGPVI